MGYVLLSSGSNYNFAVGNNTYITTESEEAVEHIKKTLDEKMAENIYTRGNYKLKAPPIKVLDALRAIDYSVVSSGGSDGRFIWTLMKLPPITIYPSATSTTTFPAPPSISGSINNGAQKNVLLQNNNENKPNIGGGGGGQGRGSIGHSENGGQQKSNNNNSQTGSEELNLTLLYSPLQSINNATPQPPVSLPLLPPPTSSEIPPPPPLLPPPAVPLHESSLSPFVLTRSWSGSTISVIRDNHNHHHRDRDHEDDHHHQQQSHHNKKQVGEKCFPCHGNPWGENTTSSMAQQQQQQQQREHHHHKHRHHHDHHGQGRTSSSSRRSRDSAGSNGSGSHRHRHRHSSSNCDSINCTSNSDSESVNIASNKTYSQVETTTTTIPTTMTRKAAAGTTDVTTGHEASSGAFCNPCGPRRTTRFQEPSVYGGDGEDDGTVQEGLKRGETRLPRHDPDNESVNVCCSGFNGLERSCNHYWYDYDDPGYNHRKASIKTSEFSHMPFKSFSHMYREPSSVSTSAKATPTPTTTTTTSSNEKGDKVKGDTRSEKPSSSSAASTYATAIGTTTTSGTYATAATTSPFDGGKF